jgi:ATP-dependent DNA ligase
VGVGSVGKHRLEGVVAKRLGEPYRPGERSWIKRKNPAWPRYQAELEAIFAECAHDDLRLARVAEAGGALRTEGVKPTDARPWTAAGVMLGSPGT